MNLSEMTSRERLRGGKCVECGEHTWHHIVTDPVELDASWLCWGCDERGQNGAQDLWQMGLMESPAGDQLRAHFRGQAARWFEGVQEWEVTQEHRQCHEMTGDDLAARCLPGPDLAVRFLLGPVTTVVTIRFDGDEAEDFTRAAVTGAPVDFKIVATRDGSAVAFFDAQCVSLERDPSRVSWEAVFEVGSMTQVLPPPEHQ